MNPSKTQVIGLFRGLLRQSRKIDNYNFRSHAERRTRHAFKEFRALQGDELVQKYNWGVNQLAMVRRARVVGELYPEGQNVMQFQKPK